MFLPLKIILREDIPCGGVIFRTDEMRMCIFFTWPSFPDLWDEDRAKLVATVIEVKARVPDLSWSGRYLTRCHPSLPGVA